MTLLTNGHKKAAWYELIDTLFRTSSCPYTKAELLAAVNATDQWIEDNAASFNAALPNPFKTTATAAQKSALFLIVARRRA